MNCKKKIALLAFIIFFQCLVGFGKVYAEPSINNPQFKVRAFHFVINNLSLSELKGLVDKIDMYGFNTLVVGLYNGVDFGVLKLSGKRLKKALSLQDFLSFVKYVRSKGLVVIPEIKLLSKQQFFLSDNYKELMYNGVTYNPNDKTLYQDVVFPYLSKVIDLVHPQAIHIGHDELAGINRHSRKKWLSDGRKMLPPNLFIKDIKLIHSYLKGKGVDTWMWGDMFLGWREFPSMYQRGGGLNGGRYYGKKLVPLIPSDVVICDWHYSDPQVGFKTLTFFQEEGFRVIGSTWKKEKTIKNFSAYAAKNHAYGMMATTWWHVQKKEWNVVDRIIEFSGQTFLKDFPDAK